jgi:signal transduction histidine kinase
MREAFHRLAQAIIARMTRMTPSLSFPGTLHLYRGWRLALAFLPLVLAFAVTGLLMLRNADALANSQRAVSSAKAIRVQIHEIEVHLSDTEDALRGYLLTGDTTYLATYTTDGSALAPDIAQLQRMIAGDPVEQHRIAALEPLVAPLLDAWQQAISLREQQRTDEAIAMTRANVVEQPLKSIRTQLTAMDGAEGRGLAALVRTAASSLSAIHATIIAATAINVALVVVLFVLVWQSFVARERHLKAEHMARAAAEEAVTLRNEFLSIASHELRTPVTVLLGNVQLLERFLATTIDQDARVRQSITALHRQIARLQARITTMLDMSRIEHGHLTITRKPLDLVALVRAIVEEIGATAPEHPIELTVPPDPLTAISIYGDAPRLEEVLLNLLQNAIKYSPVGASIQVAVQCTAEWAEVSVTDHGIGIPQEVLPHVFEQFYRAPQVRTEHVSGMGIGLYIVAEIVALHGGEVAVTSDPGIGTTFTVHLPLAAPPSSPPDATPTER